MNTDRMIERQQMANLLLWQAVLRIAGLMNIGFISAVRRALDSYLLYLRQSVDYVKDAGTTDSPEKWVDLYVDTMSECVEKSWQDFRNNLQILLLTQDEALIWTAKIEKALAGD